MIVIGRREKESIIRGIQSAIKREYTDFKMSNNFSTYNCRHFAKWDLIYTNMEKILINEGFVTIKMDRKIWQFIALVHSSTNTLYVLMRKKNFLNLQGTRKKRKIPHYVDGFSTINDYQSEYEQIKLFENQNDFEIEHIEEILNLLNIYKDEIKQFSVIAFEEEKGDLIGVENYVIDSKFNVIDSESWSELINPFYDYDVDNENSKYEYNINDENNENEDTFRLKVKKDKKRKRL